MDPDGLRSQSLTHGRMRALTRSHSASAWFTDRVNSRLLMHENLAPSCVMAKRAAPVVIRGAPPHAARERPPCSRCTPSLTRTPRARMPACMGPSVGEAARADAALNERSTHFCRSAKLRRS